MKYRNIKHIALLSTLLLGAASCSKDNQAVLETEQATPIQYNFNVSLNDIPVIDYVQKDVDKARALDIRGNGAHEAPLEFGLTASNFKVFFSAFAKKNGSFSGQADVITAIHTADQLNKDRMQGTGIMLMKDIDPTDNPDGLKTIGPNDQTTVVHRLFVSYYDGNGHNNWAPMFRPDETYAFLTLGGIDWRSGTAEGRAKRFYGLPYNNDLNAESNPNYRLYCVGVDEHRTIPFPCVTKAKRMGHRTDDGRIDGLEFRRDPSQNFNGTNVAVDLNQNFKARGCVLAFDIWNNTGKKIIVDRVCTVSNFTNANLKSPFYYRGYFDPVVLDLSAGNEEYDVPFIGTELEAELSCPLYLNENTQGLMLEAGWENHKSYFPLWGMPRKGNENVPFRCYFEYREDLGNGHFSATKKSKYIKVNAPKAPFQWKNGWTDGDCYKLPVNIEERSNARATNGEEEYLEYVCK